MAIKRGVSLYSYQQAQFFKQLDWKAQIREVHDNLKTDGIEIIDEPEEYRSAKGEKILKDFVFRTLGYEYFRVIRMDKLKESADIIKEKISHL